MEDISKLAEEAKKYEARADKLEADAEDNRWLAAQRYHHAVKVAANKVSAKAFAEMVGRKERHAQRMVQAWEKYGDRTNRIQGWTFWDHYGDRGPDRRPATENLSDEHSTPTPEQIAQAIKSDPEAYLAAKNAIDEAPLEPDDEPLYTSQQLQRAKERGEQRVRQFGDDVNQALDECTVSQTLRQAAGLIAQAIGERELFGVRQPAEEKEALRRIDHMLSLYRSGSGLTEDDRAWLEAMGVEA